MSTLTSLRLPNASVSACLQQGQLIVLRTLTSPTSMTSGHGCQDRLTKVTDISRLHRRCTACMTSSFVTDHDSQHQQRLPFHRL